MKMPLSIKIMLFMMVLYASITGAVYIIIKSAIDFYIPQIYGFPDEGTWATKIVDNVIHDMPLEVGERIRILAGIQVVFAMSFMISLLPIIFISCRLYKLSIIFVSFSAFFHCSLKGPGLLAAALHIIVLIVILCNKRAKSYLKRKQQKLPSPVTSV
ncbi:hypothetical protein [Paenibacillus sp. MMS18-CY102]|uniref:hypothetical protein n=1 Tax=Paenibacillus sp. MMS18-CY102 TaxID=2682849 RepID=UPI001365EA1A|nr:hypothetical protein [Paenibacillus sp. MMS18-CY102]MWC30016.1 hypothetical protein [Paenibacillus sp. MMS18-CY102]